MHGCCTSVVQHELELFQTGGDLLFRLWIGGMGADMPVERRLTKEQAQQLAQDASRLAACFGSQGARIVTVSGKDGPGVAAVRAQQAHHVQAVRGHIDCIQECRVSRAFGLQGKPAAIGGDDFHSGAPSARAPDTCTRNPKSSTVAR